ncbi:Pre-mRNA-splicing factor CWC25 [Thelohanellus kitauei]|uniref:Pre-mRNA-splicing factor CWC25 n=1 Tax=Thelohanellus kitauei TaxID=669202 RepID=A0A0C2IY51_THEKT|nr:Pre-mRNA-splicing factor CWC25 [Thelohanellus kitauei]
MGGGDLNMKKHFHPLTRENLEKVWLAEQKRDQELKRIEERKKEIAEEKARDELLELASRHGVIKKRDERLEWIYAGYRAASDDFLLGKEITDAFLEKAAQERKAAHQVQETGVNVDLQTVDMARKIREDPLFLIKKREAVVAKSVVENSQRIKQMIHTSRRSSRQGSVVSRNGRTPIHEKLSKTGWDTPCQNTPVRPTNKRKKSPSPDSEDDAVKLQRMLDNGKWRESTRQKQITQEYKEEEIDKQIESHIRKLKGNSSTRSLFNEIKMGNWSSQRYK